MKIYVSLSDAVYQLMMLLLSVTDGSFFVFVILGCDHPTELDLLHGND